jgi:hypothetical protein
MIIFMQAGTSLARDDRYTWSAPSRAKEPVVGKLWPGPPGRLIVQWQYKPLPFNGKNGELFNSLSLKFQLNDHSFCQWFAIIAYLADRAEPSAMHTLQNLIPGNYLQNYMKVVHFVQHSNVPEIIELRKDMVTMYNLWSFYNHEQSQKYRLTKDEIKRFFENRRLEMPCKFKRQSKNYNEQYLEQSCFFDKVRKGVSEYFNEQSRSRSIHSSSRSRLSQVSRASSRSASSRLYMSRPSSPASR